jgi:hypothetical protein
MCFTSGDLKSLVLKPESKFSQSNASEDLKKYINPER